MGAPDIFYNKLDSKGERVKVVLNERERKGADYWEKYIRNALGYEISITTLTTIMKKITEQKFFEIPPADYVPVRVGQGAWSSNLVTYRSFNQGQDFNSGILNTGGNNARLASADVGVDSLTIKVLNWGKQIGWTIMDLEMAAKSGNWDLVTSKERARKKNWDLGIQKVAFLGLTGDSSALGLFTQSGITTNPTASGGPALTQSITATAAAGAQSLSNLIAQVLVDYRVNCAHTAWPTHFVIPESDYLGLAIPSSATYPIKSILQLMLETFQTMTGNKNFKILPCAYGDKSVSGLTKQQYALYNYDEGSIRMDIPVDYTNTLANSIDNFSFQNVGYGQFTGVLAYRPLEMLYYQF